MRCCRKCTKDYMRAHLKHVAVDMSVFGQYTSHDISGKFYTGIIHVSTQMRNLANFSLFHILREKWRKRKKNVDQQWKWHFYDFKSDLFNLIVDFFFSTLWHFILSRRSVFLCTFSVWKLFDMVHCGRWHSSEKEQIKCSAWYQQPKKRRLTKRKRSIFTSRRIN